MITRLAISGYRSLKALKLELRPINVVSGANGAGKSNLYRALRLMTDVAQGNVVQSLAMEGGFEQALWAGKRASGPIALQLGFSGEEYGYAIDLGLPIRAEETAFSLDPQIKSESLWAGELLGRNNEIAKRKNAAAMVRTKAGEWTQAYFGLAPYETMMTHAADPKGAPELMIVREMMRGWRFYDQLRTDRDAPARRPCVGTRTPVMAPDGSDLPAAIQTIREIGDGAAFDASVAEAFCGAKVSISTERYFELHMTQPGLERTLSGAELSDGTLRFLLLAAALLTPRPPELMVFNEPEANLHPDLLPALASLFFAAAERSQLVVVTHSTALARILASARNSADFFLVKEEGETSVPDADPISWNWPSR
jgi:predicted ATPase